MRVALMSSVPLIIDIIDRSIGQENVSVRDIQAAARSSSAHEFIMSLPNQYETEVSESGAAVIIIIIRKMRIICSLLGIGGCRRCSSLRGTAGASGSSEGTGEGP